MSYLESLIGKLDPTLLAQIRVDHLLGNKLKSFHMTLYAGPEEENYNPHVPRVIGEINVDYPWQSLGNVKVEGEFAPAGFDEFFIKQINDYRSGKIKIETLYSIEAARLSRFFDVTKPLEFEIERALIKQRNARPREVFVGEKQVKFLL